MSSNCFHCDLVNPAGVDFQLDIFNETRYFCCPGCFEVARLICDSGQQEFYRFRTSTNQKVDAVLPQELLELESFDNSAISQEVIDKEGDLNVAHLGVEGITCAACGWLIKKQLNDLPGVESVEVNTTTRRAIVKFSSVTSLGKILKKFRSLGYRAYPYTDDQSEIEIQKEEKAYIRRLIVAGLAMMQVMMFSTGLYIGDYQDIAAEHAFFLHLVSGLLATPVVLYSAQPFLKSAFNNLKARQLGMNVPVSIAILSGYIASLYSLFNHGSVFYFDSVVMFTFFLLTGRYLEHHVRLKAILKQQNFRKLLPHSVIRYGEQESLETIPIADIKKQDLLLINSGTVVPVDGMIESDLASLDEAVITGESFPVEKQRNESVYSGSTNAGASFKLRASSDVAGSRLQNLISLQNNSENLKSQRVTLADKIANWYVLVLLVLSLLTAVFWWQVNPEMIFPVVLSLLVVSCPCALSLATPAAFASAIAKLTDKGLMIKSSNSLSKLQQIDLAIFDKTGTLTTGKFSLNKVLLHSKKSEEDCLSIAKALEQVSNHPLSRAFKTLNEVTPVKLEAKEVVSGGVEGEFQGKYYRLGKSDFALEVTSQGNSRNNPGNQFSKIYLSCDYQLVAEFFLEDTVNSTAKQSIKTLSDSGIESQLLSGDDHHTCQAIAETIGISEIKSNVTPEQKLTEIEHFNQHGRHTLMVGDGINDIGAFKVASVGVTMGHASHLSKTSSDAVLVSHDLMVIPYSIALAKKLDRIIKQNLSWAVAYNLFAIPFAIAGLVPAWLAAVGMTTSSLVVVLNALRLRK